MYDLIKGILALPEGSDDIYIQISSAVILVLIFALTAGLVFAIFERLLNGNKK